MSGLHSHIHGMLPMAPHPPIARVQNQYFAKLLVAGIFDLHPEKVRHLSEPAIADILLRTESSSWIAEIESKQLTPERELYQLIRVIHDFEENQALDFIAWFRPDQITLLLRDDIFIEGITPEDGPTLDEEDKQCIICLGEAHFELSDSISSCRECFRAGLRLSLREQQHYPLIIAGFIVHDSFIPEAHRPYLTRLYNQRRIEWHESKIPTERVYCTDARCGAYIAIESHASKARCKLALSKSIDKNKTKGDIIASICPVCYQGTCPKCRGNAHEGTCVYEVSDHDDWADMERDGVVNCPRCSAMVTIIDGCNHLTCRCGAEFCYLCGKTWRTCHCILYNAHESRLPIADRPGKKPERFTKTPISESLIPYDKEQRWFRLPALPSKARSYHYEMFVLASLDMRRCRPDGSVLSMRDMAAGAMVRDASTAVRMANRILMTEMKSHKHRVTPKRFELLESAVSWACLNMALGNHPKDFKPHRFLYQRIKDQVESGISKHGWYFDHILDMAQLYSPAWFLGRSLQLQFADAMRGARTELGRDAIRNFNDGSVCPIGRERREMGKRVEEVLGLVEDIARNLRLNRAIGRVANRANVSFAVHQKMDIRLRDDAVAVDRAVRGLRDFLDIQHPVREGPIRGTPLMREAEEMDRQRQGEGSVRATSNQRRLRKMVIRRRAMREGWDERNIS